MDSEVNLSELKAQVQKFCEDRDWDQFHGAKDLAIGAITEASELLEHFRFQSDEQIVGIMADTEKREMIGEELADVLFFLLRFSQRYDLDLSECFSKKMLRNSKKYPAQEFYGKNHKAQK